MSQENLSDLYNLELGYAKKFISALVVSKETLTSQKGNQYQVVYLQDSSGTIKALNLEPQKVILEKNKIYNLYMDIKGHKFNPAGFIKEATEILEDPLYYKTIIEQNPKKNLSHVIFEDLSVNLESVEVTPDFAGNIVKNIRFKDGFQNLFYLRLWPNNQEIYDLEWVNKEVGTEVFIELISVTKKEDSKNYYLKVIPGKTKITIL